MITREEYNKALDVVEAYHKQFFKSINRQLIDNGKTKVKSGKNSIIALQDCIKY